jgi:hypothetical protein
MSGRNPAGRARVTAMTGQQHDDIIGETVCPSLRAIRQWLDAMQQTELPGKS